VIGYVQDEVNQESEQDEVDRMNEKVDSTGEVTSKRAG